MKSQWAQIWYMVSSFFLSYTKCYFLGHTSFLKKFYAFPHLKWFSIFVANKYMKEYEISFSKFNYHLDWKHCVEKAAGEGAHIHPLMLAYVPQWHFFVRTTTKKSHKHGYFISEAHGIGERKIGFSTHRLSSFHIECTHSTGEGTYRLLFWGYDLKWANEKAIIII